MTRALLQQALDAMNERDIERQRLLADALRAELAKPDTFQPLGTVYRWTALKDGKPVYQYGEDGYPQLFAKTAVKLPDEPEPAQDNESDELLKHLGLDPERFRTDGGYINHLKVKAAIRHPYDYCDHEFVTAPASLGGRICKKCSRLENPKAQPAQEPLTDEQIAVLFEHKSGFTTKETYTNFARAIEATHGIGGKA